ncbi:hypothetical protein ATANTOWER_004402 [Ataeniobius toweri]|uniref:Uncharacterized protein n=1 Tax=Ataeniobius toweri TaxID=208326 RepID=A0ABU7AF04_9TELE|nr:hypothetical protein [Ataeniobius toweri]
MMGDMASKAQMPTPETALPGRTVSIKVSGSFLCAETGRQQHEVGSEGSWHQYAPSSVQVRALSLGT